MKLNKKSIAVLAILSPNLAFALDTLDTIEVQGQNVQSQTIDSFGQKFNKKNYPKQINTFTQANLKNTQANTAFDILAKDASVNNNYTPLGYQENYSIRGNTLNLDSSYTLNGVPFTHRQIPNLANIESIEVQKGFSDNANINGGGSVNYITKRPKDVRNITINKQSIGTYGISADIGSKKNDVGYRLNLDYQHLEPYIKTANGHKYLTSLALDGKSNKLSWQLDANYQAHKQFTVPGIQLLDNSVIPIVPNDIMLNNSSWRKPVETKAFNIGTKLKYDLSTTTNLTSSMQYSKTKIDDYVAFPYSFKANGDYKLADYQSPDQSYINKYIDLAFNTSFNIAKINNKFTLGASYLTFDKKGKDSISYAKETRNIYSPEVVNSYTLTGETLGNTYKMLDHTQKSLFVRDVMTYGNTSLFAGGRFSKVEEKAFNANGQIANTSKNVFLPNIALSYDMGDLGLYTSYAKNLEIGRDSDVIGYNSSYLPAKKVRQFEVGFNYQKDNNKIQGAYFDTKKPFEYVDSNYQYVQDGTEKRRGLELNLSTRQDNTTFGLSTAYFLKATQNGTQMASYNGAKAVNVPKFKSRLWVDYAIPQYNSSIGAGWNYEGKKSVLNDASVSIPSYSTFDVNAKYAKAYGKNLYTFRVGVDNITNKKYFKDAGLSYGESYIHFGSPRTYKASLSMDF